MRPHKLEILTFLAGIMLVWVEPCFPMGAQESRLIEVQQLIADKNYDLALLLLSQIAKENPDLWDETSSLMERIRAIRSQYNQKYTEFIAAIDKGDVETGLAIIKELETLDPHANKAIQGTISQAKKEVVYKTNANFFTQLMDKALSELDQKKYAEAAANYLSLLDQPETSGSDLHRGDFLAAGYGSIVENNVLGMVAQIQTAGAAAEKSVTALASIGQIVAGTDSGAAGEGSISGFESAITPLRQAIDLERRLRVLSRGLSDVNTGIQAGAAEKKDLFVTYLDEILTGRKDKQEGLIFTVHLIWRGAAEVTADRTGMDLRAAFDSVLALFEAGNSEAAATLFTEIPFRAAIAVKAVVMESSDLLPEPGWNFTLQQGQEARDYVSLATEYQDIAEQSRAYLALISLAAGLKRIPSAESMTPEILAQNRNGLASLLQDAEAAKQEWTSRRDNYAGNSRLISSFNSLAISAGKMAERFQSFQSDAMKKDLDLAVRMAQIQSADFESRFSRASELRMKAEAAMSGEPVEGIPATGPQPSQALTIFASIQASLSELSADISGFETLWTSDTPYVVSDQKMVALIAAADDVLKKAAAESDIIASATLKAQQQYDRAVELAQEGAKNFDQAVMLSQSDPERASKFLTDAWDAFGKSLGYEEDPAVRGRMEQGGDIQKLQAQISNSIQKKLVTEVEKLINDGIKLFTNGDYIAANQKFTQADARWKERHPGETYSSDLKYWLTLSKTAQAVSGTREISSTDANYEVVSAFLNLANQSYLDAKKLIAQGKKDEAAYALDEAKINLQSVLSIYPEYRVARVLSLKITQLADPKNFPALLRQEINRNVNGAKNGTIEKREAYLALKDIQEFAPILTATERASLATAVLNLEYDLQLRQKPLPQEKIAESNRKYQSAKAIFKRGVSETYQPALDDLKASLDANPLNTDARNLRAIILTQMNVPVEGLSTVAMREYLKAKDLLNSGSIANSYAIADQLMQDPKNANYPPLVELYNKLKKILGI